MPAYSYTSMPSGPDAAADRDSITGATGRRTRSSRSSLNSSIRSTYGEGDAFATYGGPNYGSTGTPNVPSPNKPNKSLWIRPILCSVILSFIVFIMYLRQTSSESQLRYPEGAYWVNAADDYNCSRIGVRERSAILHGTPLYWNDRIPEACYLVPLSRDVDRGPNRCDFIERSDGSVQATGIWEVRDQSCQPTWNSIIAGDCAGVDRRAYAAEIDYLPPGINPRDACEKTPGVIHQGRSSRVDEASQTRKTPDRCTSNTKETGSVTLVGAWEIPDSQCEVDWGFLEPGDCASIGLRTYTASIKHLLPGLTPRDACEKTAMLPETPGNPEQTHFPHEQMRRIPDRCSTIDHSDSSFEMLGAWDIADDSCQAAWGPVSAENCVSIGVGSYSAKIADLPQGLDALTVCKHTPVMLDTGKRLHQQHCLVSKSGDIFARGIADSESCRPSISSSESKCSSPGVRHYISKVHVPPGLDPLRACEYVEFEGAAPEQCILTNSEVEAHWHRSEDADCMPTWDHIPKADDQCLSYGLRRFTAILRHMDSSLDKFSACLNTPGHVKEQRWWKPDECIETEDGFMRGVWIVDFDVPECVPELKNIQGKGCLNGLQHVEGDVQSIWNGGPNGRWYDICTTTPLYWSGIKHLPRDCKENIGKTIFHGGRTIAFYEFEDDECS